MQRFLLFLALLFSCSINAQKIRFTDSTNKWFVLAGFYNGSSYEYTPYKCRYEGFVQQDTLVYNIFRAGMLDSALIREDTIAGKIYAKVFYHQEYNDTSEFVLFDYNLQVGDTFITRNIYRKVTEIDSTLINSVWHRVYSLQDTGWWGSVAPYKFIEGIGTLWEPLFPGYEYMFEYGRNLVCFENNSINPALTPAVDAFDNNTSCADSILSVKFLREIFGRVEIYPLPATKSVQIRFPKVVKNGELRIIDYTGRTVYNKSIPEADEITFYNHDGLCGIYFYTITSNNGNALYKGKLQFLN